MNETAKHHFALEESLKEDDVKKMLQKIYEHEFTEPQLKEEDKDLLGKGNVVSVDDRKFLKLMKENTTMIQGHYQVPLPLKDENVKLPNNRKQALWRLQSLQKRFVRDQNFFQDYSQFIEDMIKNEYAEPSSGEVKEGQTWYLPHHGVYHPQKPEKIRVVFDCSATCNNRSIN